jgi:hypothetical protein
LLKITYINITLVRKLLPKLACININFLKVMGDKCKENLIFHESALIFHYYLF